MHSDVFWVLGTCYRTDCTLLGHSWDPHLTLLGPAYLDISKDQPGAHCAPPLNILGLGGVRVQFLFGNDFQLLIDHIQKDLLTLDA